MEDKLADKRTTLTLPNKDLLRGTTTATVLSGFGRRLRRTAGGIGSVAEQADDEFERSFVVSSLSYFLSHSWHAVWWLKYFTVLLYFNVVPATVSAMAVGVGLTLGQFILRDHLRHNVRLVSFSAGGVAYLVTLFSWHFVASRLPLRWGRKSIFLDNVCIHQSDQRRKEDGIKSIGGILARSKTLLVTWDATYFSRLWCTYEISVFKYNMPDSNVVIIPIRTGGLIAAMLCGEFFAELTMAMMWDSERKVLNRATVYRIYLGCWLPAALCCARLLRHYADDVAALDQQLAGFSVHNAECFCCKVNHRHPQTGERLGCDRELVYGSILHWQTELAFDVGLENFDRMIQSSFRADVKRSMGSSSAVPYHWMLTIGVGSGLSSLDWSIALNHSRWVCAAKFINWSFFVLQSIFGILIVVSRYFQGSVHTKWAKFLMDSCIAVSFVLLLWLFEAVEVRILDDHGSFARDVAQALALFTGEGYLLWLIYFRPPGKPYRPAIGHAASQGGAVHVQMT